MIAIHDPDLPGLSDLDTAALRRITGADDVSVLRFRYRSGERAILHLSTDCGEGSAWFFQGDKAKRLARDATPMARYDVPTEALYQTFPSDHRMPQIRAFLEDYDHVTPGLIGGELSGPPELLRYRPGLSCTFRCHAADGSAVYVKLINGDSPAQLAGMNRQMVSQLTGTQVTVAPAIGTAPDYGAIAYRAAVGRSLDAALASQGDARVAKRAIKALRQFSSLKLIPTRHLSADVLCDRGAESVALTKVTAPSAASDLERVLARLERRAPPLAMRPIHADMKLEHLFIDGDRTTLIDTENVSLGPPDYDLAQLYGRLWQSELEGLLPRALVENATDMIRAEAGDSFEWCLNIVTLSLAKFYAQRPTADAADKIAAIVGRLS